MQFSTISAPPLLVTRLEDIKDASNQFFIEKYPCHSQTVEMNVRMSAPPAKKFMVIIRDTV